MKIVDLRTSLVTVYPFFADKQYAFSVVTYNSADGGSYTYGELCDFLFSHN